ncbi:hypothetical protein CC2G_013658 [Coprinopsis cinerea AmutBmut pab1-1]|nr:hypothetical protein CC2G_013658 [Coprinopsis cinerea AmutBmut pab1-1]
MQLAIFSFSERSQIVASPTYSTTLKEVFFQFRKRPCQLQGTQVLPNALTFIRMEIQTLSTQSPHPEAPKSLGRYGQFQSPSRTLQLYLSEVENVALAF